MIQGVALRVFRTWGRKPSPPAAGNDDVTNMGPKPRPPFTTRTLLLLCVAALAAVVASKSPNHAVGISIFVAVFVGLHGITGE